MSKEMSFETKIQSHNGWFDLHIEDVWKYRDLVLLFVKRDFISLYKQTILGPAWAIIQPLLTTLVLTLIFGNIAGLGAAGVPTFIFFLSGTVLWAYFSGAMSAIALTFISNSSILGKVYFPRLVMPISAIISNMVNLTIQYGFMLLFLVYYLFSETGVHPNLYILITPLIFLQLAMFGLGCGIIISALTTKYRDLKMLITFGLQLWMYASPVAYDMYRLGGGIFAIGGKWHSFYMLNPITPMINMFRYAYLGIGGIEWNYYIISWVTTLVVLFFGIVMFSHVEKTFIDTV